MKGQGRMFLCIGVNEIFYSRLSFQLLNFKQHVLKTTTGTLELI
jgi:hypothetical protein